MGCLLRRGISHQVGGSSSTGRTRSFWEKLKPIKDEARVDMGYMRWMSETEYLYDELLRYLDKHPELSTEFKNPLKTK